MRRIEGYIFMDDGAFAPGRIYIDEGIIKSVERIPEVSLSPDEADTYVIPGLVDIHSHGAMGVDVCECNEDELIKLADYETRNGITSYCPATMTLPMDKLEAVVRKLGSSVKNIPVFKGLYLEGPYLNAGKCGAQNSEYITNPDAGAVRKLNDISGGMIKVVAVAPEQDGAMKFIKDLSEDFVISLAHTDADYDTAMEAIGNGATQATHLYNAMSAYNHRNPGVVGAVMDSNNVKVELIADGIHIHPAVVRNTFKYFGRDRVILISDSMAATGMANGIYSLAGQKVSVRDRVATVLNGLENTDVKDEHQRVLAGSASNLMDCVKQAISMGIPREDAIIAATRTPARQIGIFKKTGSITPGKAAELVITDDKLNVKEVI